MSSVARGFSTDKIAKKSPMFVYYRNDGVGRDQYIAWNNGGLSHAGDPISKQIKPSVQLYVGNGSPKPRDFCPSPNLGMKYPSKYTNDGTGRDQYININSGGFLPPKTVAEFSQTFHEKLRTNQRLVYYHNKRNAAMDSAGRTTMSNLMQHMNQMDDDAPIRSELRERLNAWNKEKRLSNFSA